MNWFYFYMRLGAIYNTNWCSKIAIVSVSVFIYWCHTHIKIHCDQSILVYKDVWTYNAYKLTCKYNAYKLTCNLMLVFYNLLDDSKWLPAYNIHISECMLFIYLFGHNTFESVLHHELNLWQENVCNIGISLKHSLHLKSQFF